MVPIKLKSKYRRGFATLSATAFSPAKWITASNLFHHQLQLNPRYKTLGLFVLFLFFCFYFLFLEIMIKTFILFSDFKNL